jgi:hypothetical protein
MDNLMGALRHSTFWAWDHDASFRSA